MVDFLGTRFGPNAMKNENTRKRILRWTCRLGLSAFSPKVPRGQRNPPSAGSSVPHVTVSNPWIVLAKDNRAPSSFPRRRESISLFSNKTAIQVFPLRVIRLDQPDPPRPPPLLHLLLTADGADYTLKPFEIDQSVDPVPLGETVDDPSLCSLTRLTRLEVTPMYKVPFGLLASMYT